MQDPLRVGGSSVEAGKHEVIELPVARRASGDLLRIAVHVVRGTNDGPVLGLTSTSHGDEAFSIETIRQVLTGIDPVGLKGTVIAVPLLNPVAFESFTRTTGQGMNTDQNNMNRVFPGDASGWLTEQMAAVVSAHVVPHLTHLLDFHTGGLDTGIDYTLVELPDGELGEETQGLARAFGSEILYVTRGGIYTGTLTGYARSRGIVCIVPEVGGCGLGPAYQEKAVRGVRNVLAYLRMIDQRATRPERQRIVTRRTLLGPRNGGLFYPVVGYEALGSTVAGGSILGRVLDAGTFEELEVLVAPYEHTMMIMIRGVLSRVNPGDYAYIVGDEASVGALP